MFYITGLPLYIHVVFGIYNLEVRLNSTLTFVPLYIIGRSRDKINHLFIHLNLCIALALGLIAFIAGIESATENEVCATAMIQVSCVYEYQQGACTFVAALLQYLFISAFCWMLCEGVMLYMMLVTVFGNKLNKRRFFFLLGWGECKSLGQIHCIVFKYKNKYCP